MRRVRRDRRAGGGGGGGGSGGGADEKMKGTGGEVKINSRLEERGWNRNGWREWRLNSGWWAGGLPPPVHCACKSLLLQFLF